MLNLPNSPAVARRSSSGSLASAPSRDRVGRLLDLKSWASASTSYRVPGKGAKFSSPDRAVTSTCFSLRCSAIASGAGRWSSTTPSLPAARSRRDVRPSRQTSTAMGLSPSATSLRSSFVFSTWLL